jgi:transcription antitermination factor NusG
MTPNFTPGTRVAITSGSFVGMSGEVINAAQRNAIHDAEGKPRLPPEADAPGFVWVRVPIFGRPVAIQLETWQIQITNSN